MSKKRSGKTEQVNGTRSVSVSTLKEIYEVLVNIETRCVEVKDRSHVKKGKELYGLRLGSSYLRF